MLQKRKLEAAIFAVVVNRFQNFVFLHASKTAMLAAIERHTL